MVTQETSHQQSHTIFVLFAEMSAGQEHDHSHTWQSLTALQVATTYFPKPPELMIFAFCTDVFCFPYADVITGCDKTQHITTFYLKLFI